MSLCRRCTDAAINAQPESCEWLNCPFKDKAERDRLAAKVGELSDLLRKHTTTIDSTGRCFCQECGRSDGVHTERCAVLKALAGNGSAVADVIAAARWVHECSGMAEIWPALDKLDKALDRLDGKEADDGS